jgi:lysozyme
VIEQSVEISREALVKPFEGYHKRLPDGGCKAYADPATGKEPWTIGWGTTGPDVKQDTVWSKQQAQNALNREILNKCLGLLSYSPKLLETDANKLAALISFAYNCGLGNYRISTLRKRVEAKDWEGARQEIVKWNKAAGRVLPGLTRRRIAEAAFLK